ncbi:GNAT family N-acetyltransferase [Microvirga roseola]|uniref:GNAT family N-acetyltransferase n=1 Tax=Microvirga roseola TaxID=2883126 RepID=UPI001E2ED1EE|nr:GNAT family N-acetyltransferase [Microvirga roseola]
MAGRAMKVDILSDPAGLEEEWWDLWHRDPAASAFQSPAWLVPWRGQFSEGESRILALRDQGRLMGLLPLFRREGRLLPWGAGTSDRLDGIFDPELELAQVSRGLAELGEPLDLFQLRSGSLLLEAKLPDGWTETRGHSEPCVEMTLPAELPRNMAQNLRYYRRRADRTGIAEAERAGPDILDELVELHTRRWLSREEPGVLADPRVLAWHREALPALQAAGLLRLYALRLHGRIVAALYVLLSKQRACYYIGGFDPDFERLGLGTVLVGHAIAEAEREEGRVFDFLRGQEPYKYRWGAADTPTFARILHPPGR